VPIGVKGSNHRTEHLKQAHAIPFSPGFVAYWFLEASEYVDDTILIHCKKNLCDSSTEIIFNSISYSGVKEKEIFWFDRPTLLAILQKLKEMSLIYIRRDGWIKPTILGKQVLDYMGGTQRLT